MWAMGGKPGMGKAYAEELHRLASHRFRPGGWRVEIESLATEIPVGTQMPPPSGGSIMGQIATNGIAAGLAAIIKPLPRNDEGRTLLRSTPLAIHPSWIDPKMAKIALCEAVGWNSDFEDIENIDFATGFVEGTLDALEKMQSVKDRPA
jgi:hypothetical protein